MRELRFCLSLTGTARPEDELGAQMRVEAAGVLDPASEFAVLAGGPEVVFDSLVENEADGVFSESGTLRFANGTISFITENAGNIDDCAEPTLQHGRVVWAVEGGTGAFDGASGYILSNFTVSELAEVRDLQAGIVFLP